MVTTKVSAPTIRHYYDLDPGSPQFSDRRRRKAPQLRGRRRQRRGATPRHRYPRHAIAALPTPAPNCRTRRAMVALIRAPRIGSSCPGALGVCIERPAFNPGPGALTSRPRHWCAFSKDPHRLARWLEAVDAAGGKVLWHYNRCGRCWPRSPPPVVIGLVFAGELTVDERAGRRLRERLYRSMRWTVWGIRPIIRRPHSRGSDRMANSMCHADPAHRRWCFQPALTVCRWALPAFPTGHRLLCIH